MIYKRLCQIRKTATEALIPSLQDAYAQLFKMIDEGISAFPDITAITGVALDAATGNTVHANCVLTGIKEKKDFIVPGVPAAEYASRALSRPCLSMFRVKRVADGAYRIGPIGIAIPYGYPRHYRSFECDMTVYIQEVSAPSELDVALREATGMNGQVLPWRAMLGMIGTTLCINAAIAAAIQHSWSSLGIFVILGILNVWGCLRPLRS